MFVSHSGLMFSWSFIYTMAEQPGCNLVSALMIHSPRTFSQRSMSISELISVIMILGQLSAMNEQSCHFAMPVSIQVQLQVDDALWMLWNWSRIVDFLIWASNHLLGIYVKFEAHFQRMTHRDDVEVHSDLNFKFLNCHRVIHDCQKHILCAKVQNFQSSLI